jgi:hypothetical protein
MMCERIQACLIGDLSGSSGSIAWPSISATVYKQPLGSFIPARTVPSSVVLRMASCELSTRSQAGCIAPAFARVILDDDESRAGRGTRSRSRWLDLSDLTGLGAMAPPCRSEKLPAANWRRRTPRDRRGRQVHQPASHQFLRRVAAERCDIRLAASSELTPGSMPGSTVLMEYEGECRCYRAPPAPERRRIPARAALRGRPHVGLAARKSTLQCADQLEQLAFGEVV